jgi:hypothetical protein
MRSVLLFTCCCRFSVDTSRGSVLGPHCTHLAEVEDTPAGPDMAAGRPVPPHERGGEGARVMRDQTRSRLSA